MRVLEIVTDQGSIFLNMDHIVFMKENRAQKTELHLSVGPPLTVDSRYDQLSKLMGAEGHERVTMEGGESAAWMKHWADMAAHSPPAIIPQGRMPQQPDE